MEFRAAVLRAVVVVSLVTESRYTPTPGAQLHVEKSPKDAARSAIRSAQVAVQAPAAARGQERAARGSRVFGGGCHQTGELSGTAGRECAGGAGGHHGCLSEEDGAVG